MSIIIYPYKKGLNSTKQLREAGCKVRYDTSRVRQGVAIAWGNRTPPPWAAAVTWINDPASIHRVAYKLAWAEHCRNTGFGPKQTVDKEEAMSWADQRGEKVLCRTLLNASGGRGIEVARTADEVVDAPLYSRYFKKNREYRVIMDNKIGSVVYCASKRRPNGVELEGDDALIRTLDRGYVYQTEEIVPYPVLAACQDVASWATQYGLNLLAYDVGYNSEENTACVFEANTAPGLNVDSAPLVVAVMEEMGEDV